MDIIGREVMVVGDLHISDRYRGRHISFLQDCFEVLGDLTREINLRKPAALVLAGDLIGWNETNISDREVFAKVCKIFREWSDVCPIFAVRGNHDMRGYPDFQFLADFGLINTSQSCGGYFDFYGYEGQEVPEVRFHLVDYGDESRHIDILEGTSNIAVVHNNFTIDGLTTWYADHDGLELGLQQNFVGIDFVLAGHIHNPSPEFYAVTMPDGNPCTLFYMGNPTRVIKDKNPYDTCWFVYVQFDGEGTEIIPEMYHLKPVEECFYPDEEFIEESTPEQLAEEVRKESLKNVLDDLLKYRLNSGDPFSQVMKIPNATDAAKQMAIDYLQAAFNGGI